MRPRQVICPSCHATLEVPEHCVNCIARCGRCHTRFRVLTDDAIAGWINEGIPRESDFDEVPPPRPPRAPVQAPRPAAASPPGAAPAPAARPPGRPVMVQAVKPEVEPPRSGHTAVLTAITDPIRLVKIDGSGVLFEFPAQRMLEEQFRCAMPRRCLQCGTRTHLRAHVIVYSSSAQLRDSVSLEDEHSAGPLTLSEDELRNLSAEEVVRRMQKVPNVPAPGNEPMPYWVCDMCSGTGVISGQIQVNSQTGVGFCRLLIRSQRRAAEFFGAVGGGDSREYRDLMRRIAATAENPWDSLPEAIQHRVQQWFKPYGDEQFIAYIPDRDHFRTEDGMAGMVVSTKRLIYHTRVRHHEVGVADAIEFGLAMTGGKGTLQIKTPPWEVRRMSVDRDGTDRLRRAMVVGRFKAVWH
ncbi:MAG: hypothetical protein ACE15C_16765 [Phycisphaerae bacterium]